MSGPSEEWPADTALLFTEPASASVGAGLLAMVVNDDAYLLSKCGALKTIASKPAPTEAEIA